MPSLIHEGLADLFRTSPDLAVDCVSSAVSLPAYDRIDVKPGDLVELVPASLRADALLLLVRSEPVFAILVEVQLKRDPEKRFSWPFYAAATRARYRCPTLLLVVAVDDDVAEWCARPIDVGQPDSPFRPFVKGANAVRKVTDPAEARAHPYRALLSTMLYRNHPDAAAIGRAAWAGVDTFPEAEREVWQTAILGTLNDAAREALEDFMDLSKFPVETNWFYKKGEKVGEAKGKAEGKAEGVLTVLTARGLPISDQARQHILATTDQAQLDDLLARAATVTSVDQLLPSTT